MKPKQVSAILTVVATISLFSLLAISSGASASTQSGTTGPKIEKLCGPVSIGFARCFVQKLVNPSSWRGSHLRKPSPGSTSLSGYIPSELQSAYSLGNASANSGGTMTVAIVDAYSDPYLASNLATYRNQFGLKSCSSGCLTIVNQSGGTKLPRANSGWGTEESLDVEMVSAICPNCHILVVEASSASFSNLGTAAKYAESHANVVSNSYGGSESSAELSYNSDYSSSNSVVVASSGDSGYGVEFPAAAPSVVSAGGTSLLQSSTTARGWSETAWSGAGSGCSGYEAEPSWQPKTSYCSMRTVADVSAVADPNTGVAIYDTYGQGGWIVVGGTSVASPLISSVFALAGNNAASLGSTAAAGLYASGASLYRVTSGSNGSCGNYLCNAGDSLSTGYNGPTGNGTPNGTSAF